MSQITTHVLDTARGRPAQGLPLTLYTQQGGDWQELAGGITDADGRVSDLLRSDRILDAGDYRMHFATQTYFEAQGLPVFYPYADVVFRIDGAGEHFHIPLLLSPYGYSTYRGS